MFFSFLLSANGRLIPAGSKEYGTMFEAVIYGNAYSDRWMWNTTFSSSAACLGEGSSGESYTARIIAEGWQMNY